ncbi:hypothetical protein AWJ20_1675 [Sugiyamaella lignohabitans]|uniref:SH3 domain-containing protein n=1 Tax=Sugiyamaella lignohabitans TaxID=796027 RepID=A0A167DWQ6_9ASCO|nr:uncharacterized protein AWJ20_1675 [Sugiyamaella lignohabitans]ANB13385.1 hypothetical protein AWJ20_1675 [Sugiyamaella lignohabitans]
MDKFKTSWIVAIVVPVVGVILLTGAIIILVIWQRGGNFRRSRILAEAYGKNNTSASLEGDDLTNMAQYDRRPPNGGYAGETMFGHKLVPVAEYRRKQHLNKMMTVPEAHDDDIEPSNGDSTTSSDASPHGKKEEDNINDPYEELNLDKTDLHLDVERNLSQRSRFGSFVSNIFFGGRKSADSHLQRDYEAHPYRAREYSPENVNEDVKEENKTIDNDNAAIITPSSKVLPASESIPKQYGFSESVDSSSSSSPAPRISFHINQMSSFLPSELLFDNNSENNSLYSFTHSTRSHKKLQRHSGSNQSAAGFSIASNGTSAFSVGSVPGKRGSSSNLTPARNVKLQSPLFKEDSRPIRRRRSSLTHRGCNTPSSARSTNGDSPSASGSTGSSLKQATILTASRLVLDKPLPDRPDDNPHTAVPASHRMGLVPPARSPIRSPLSLQTDSEVRQSPPPKFSKNSPHSSARSSPLRVANFRPPSITPSPGSSVTAVTAKTSQTPDSISGSMKQRSTIASDASLPLAPPPPMPVSAEQNMQEEGVVAVVEQICRVATSFRPKLYDELTLNRGDKVVVFKLFDDGWCTAQYLDDYLKGSKNHGVCPQGCLTPI